MTLSAQESDPQTAMLLTQAEWDDLEQMVMHFRGCTNWVDLDKRTTPDVEVLRRRRALATRIIEANR